jgi:peptidoglycan/LPS O-acetylase OafA/YrhL
MSTVTAAPAAVAPVVAPPPGHPRFPLMDSLRAIAALSVLVGHVAGLAQVVRHHWWSPLLGSANQGVTVFFVLSGFLLYRPMVSSQLGGAPRPPWRDYVRRRLLRILPAYWLALTVLAIYPGLPGVFSSEWWRYYGLLQVYSPTSALGGIVVAWSLCIEVSFYLALPLYATAIGWLTRRLSIPARVRAELGVLLALSVASLALYALDPGGQRAFLPFYLWWFCAGMGLALISAALDRRPGGRRPAAVAFIGAHPGVVWGVAGGLYVALCYLLGDPPATKGYDVAHEVLVNRGLGGLVGLVLVLPAVFGDRAGGWPRAVLAWRPLAWLGLISYGVYLWHLNLLGVVTDHVTVLGNRGVGAFPLLLALVAACTVAVAAMSYYVVERPVLRLKLRRGERTAATRSEAGTR